MSQQTTETPAAGDGTRDTGPDLRDILDVLVAHRWVILGATVLAGGIALGVTLQLPEVYQASCTVEFDPMTPRPLGDDVEDVAMPVSSFLLTREFFETQNRILASRGVAERVVKRLRLHESPDFFAVPAAARKNWTPVSSEKAAQELQNRIEVDPLKGTRIVRIKVRDDDPERAASLANALADAYIDKTMEDRLGSTVTALEWLATQLDNLRSELESTEMALHDFNKESGILSVSMEERQSQLTSDIQQLSEALTQTRTRRIEVAARLERLRSAVGEEGEINTGSLPGAAAIDDLRSALRGKVAERRRASVRYGAAHPTIKALDAEIDVLSTQVRELGQEFLDEAAADLFEVQRSEQGLSSALADLNQAALKLNLAEIEYRKLNRDWENSNNLYKLLLQRTTETDMTRMFRSTHVRVVDRALAPTSAVSPNVPLNSAAGLGLGLALGVAIAFVLRRLDQRIQTAEQVEQLGLSLLGVVPDVVSARHNVVDGSGDSGGVGGEPDRLIVVREPRSAAAECYRTVRTNLTFMSVSNPIRSLVVTSAMPEEGKTTVAANLATTLAQSGKRVLLIDTDLRRPRLHRVFGLPQGHGTSSVLVGEANLADAASPIPGVDNLDVLVSGPTPPNPSELLHGRGFSSLIESALAHYDRVIFDSPPLNAVTDAAVIAPQVDGVVLVINAGGTTRDALRFSLRQLRDVGARILGGVLNSVRATSGRYGYGSRHYYYYRADGYEPTLEDGPGSEEDRNAA